MYMSTCVCVCVSECVFVCVCACVRVCVLSRMCFDYITRKFCAEYKRIVALRYQEATSTKKGLQC